MNEADLDAFKCTYEVGRKPSKRHFYPAQQNSALFQPFVKKDVEKEQFARSISVEDPVTNKMKLIYQLLKIVI
ncbi:MULTISPECIES: hypothetical protein [Priestia]|uniref:hypothetical protein n=1 Tax=Priestia TaxID=2800373 RepID=UPI00232F6DF2|nr:hypothetical protein [Priestia sp. AB]MDC0706642.1 hypothetical protein [Priestia sp. AB]